MQRKEAVTPNLCDTEKLMRHKQRLRHLISEKGRSLSTGACDVTERAPRKARVTAKFGLCRRECGRHHRTAYRRASCSALTWNLKVIKGTS